MRATAPAPAAGDPADLGLCDTQNRSRLAAVSLLPHALDPTGQAGLPPVPNTVTMRARPRRQMRAFRLALD